MNTIDLYKDKEQCCGCEACHVICPKQLIAMGRDEEGFLYPYIKSDVGCLNCKLCLRVCPVKSSSRNNIKLGKSYGGQCKDEDGVKFSSSGGYAYAISKQFIINGGLVIGVRYSKDYTKSEYAIAETINEVESFRTSKYIQAEKGSIFQTVKKNEGRKILFIGLPCEISALYNYLGNYTDNLYTISLICHGPTSPLVQELTCLALEKQYNSTINSFSVRAKEKGWKPYYLKATFDNGQIYNRIFKGSPYELAFQYLKRPSCSKCRYKLGDENFGLTADLTLGDFHAVEKSMPHYNSWGVSQASVQTEKGDYLISLIENDCNLFEIPDSFIKKYNYAYHHPVKKKMGRSSYRKEFILNGLTAASKIPIVTIPSYLNKIKRVVISALYNVKQQLLRNNGSKS